MEGIIYVTLLVLLYFLPAFNGYSRKHASGDSILLLNLFLGWTVIGWLAALIWSASGNTRKPDAADKDEPTPQTHVRCPECRELVRHDARKCKHCGCALIPQ